MFDKDAADQVCLLTFAICTTLGNSVRQEMGITSWWVFSLFLSGHTWKSMMWGNIPISWEGDDLTEMILETSPPWSGCPWLPPAPPTHCPKYSICYSTVGTTVDTLSSFTAPMITPVQGECAYSVNNALFRNTERTNTQKNGAISPIFQMIQWWSEWGLGQRLFFYYKKKQAL